VSESRRAWLPYFALVGLALIWGLSFFFIKIAVQDMSPLVLVLVRSGAGCVALAGLMFVMRRPLVPAAWQSRIIAFTVMATAGALIPWAAIAWGEEHITSGLASILNATTPLWAAVLAYWVIPTERPSLVNYAGVVIGFGGVVILVLPKLASSGLGGDVLGTLAIVFASACYAVAAVYQRRKMRGVDPYEASLGQLVMSVLIAVPFAIPTVPAIHLRLGSMAAVVVLGAAGSGVAYLLYYYLLNSLGPVRGSGVTLLVPVTAVFWGVILLHETVTISIIIGMVVILVGIVLSNLRRRQSQPAAQVDPAAA
jgi:drug/metabolite transporter (DMT)-like permease